MHKSGIMTEKDMDVCIKGVADGSMTALKELYEELKNPIYKFALSITKSRDSSEDILQEAFLRIRANAQTYRPKGNPRAWIFSIVRNMSVSELRRVAKIVDIDELDDNSNSYVGNFEIDETGLLLDLLNDDEREILSLRVFGELKHNDIARLLDISYEQARWKYTYAIKKLRKHLINIKKKEGISIETKEF